MAGRWRGKGEKEGKEARRMGGLDEEEKAETLLNGEKWRKREGRGGGSWLLIQTRISFLFCPPHCGALPREEAKEE